MIKYPKVIYAAQTDPVTKEDAKATLYITNTDRDAVIARLVTTSIKLCENYSGRSFITQTRQMKLDAFPGGCFPHYIYLPYGPVLAISGTDAASSPNTLGVTYVDEDAATQTLVLNTDFYLDDTGDLSRIAPVDDWPTDVDDERINAITITYKAGYGAAAAVDPIAKEAILVQVAYMHEHPDKAELCEGAMSLLDTIKVYHNAWQD